MLLLPSFPDLDSTVQAMLSNADLKGDDSTFRVNRALPFAAKLE